MKTILITASIILTNSLFGQYLEFRNEKKELIIGKHYSGTFTLKNGSVFKGSIDTLTETFIVIKSEKIGRTEIQINEIEKIKKCDYLYKLGPSFRIGHYCVTTNLAKYKWKIKKKGAVVK